MVNNNTEYTRSISVKIYLQKEVSLIYIRLSKIE